MPSTARHVLKFVAVWIACASGAAIYAQIPVSNTKLQTFVNVLESDPDASLRTLVDAKQWHQAASMIIALRDSPSNQLVESKFLAAVDTGSLPTTLLSYRRYLNEVANDYLTKHQELRDHWRNLVRLRVASQIQNGFENLAEMRIFVERFAIAEGGDRLLLELASRYAEAGHLQDAIWFLSQLDPRFERYRKKFGESAGNFSLPVTSLDQNEIAEAAARLLIMVILHYPELYTAEWTEIDGQIEANAGSSAGEFPNDIGWFRREFGSAKGRLGNEEGKLDRLLIDWAETAKSRRTLTQQQTAVHRLPELERQPWSLVMDTSNSTPVEPDELAPANSLTIHPIAIEQKLIWRDTSRIFVADLDTGLPFFLNGVEAESADQSLERFVVWRNVRGSSWPDAIPRVNQFLLASDSDQVFGIFDLVESNCIVGINLGREGRLLPGFPVKPPDSSWQFEGPPVVNDGKMFVSARRYLADNQRIESHVMCYGLRMNETRAPLTLLWSHIVCQSQLQPVNKIDGRDSRLVRRSGTRLTVENGRVFYCNNHGVITCLRETNGNVEWLFRYPRSNYADHDPFQSRLPQRRFGLAPMVRRNAVIAMPADSPLVYSINKYSGRLDWQTYLPNAWQLLDITEPQGPTTFASDFLIGGDQLVWLDANTGEIRYRYPEYHPNSLPGMRRSAERGWGQPAQAPYGYEFDSIFFPTRDGIHILLRPLIFEFVSGNRQRRRPGTPQNLAVPKKQGIMAGEFAGGGNLLIENGMIVIANSKEIRAIPLSTIDLETEQDRK